MDHLRKIVHRLRPGEELVNAPDAFFFRERSFYFEIVSGRRPRIASLIGLFRTLINEPFSLKNKIAIATFFLVVFVLPSDRRKSLLTYRLQPTNRSALGLARQILWSSHRIPVLAKG
jgi:hypothetical protein